MPPTSTTSKIFLDFYFFSSIFLCILAAELENIKLAILAGMFFAFVVTCGHNFVHMKDSWRTYYYYCVSFSVRLVKNMLIFDNILFYTHLVFSYDFAVMN